MNTITEEEGLSFFSTQKKTVNSRVPLVVSGGGAYSSNASLKENGGKRRIAKNLAKEVEMEKKGEM
jgi:hypothetical protein